MLCYYCMYELEDMSVCPHCHHSGVPHSNPHCLLPGTVLQERYTIGRVLGEGGFGITYIGRDNVFDLIVAVKEFFPNGYARRDNSVDNTVWALGEDEFFNRGKQRFLQEAKTLVRFRKEPGIVDVTDYIEANNTAYIIMEYLNGSNLSALLKKQGTISSHQAFTMFFPVMESLDKIHREGIIHRDISPDNIMVMDDGSLKLMDFGAARDYADDNKSLSVVLKHGYAPEEQYRRRGEQGPWTDVYALCATIYRCITGMVPLDSVDRLYKDSLKKPSDLGVVISNKLEQILMYGLAVRKEDRCPDIETLLKLIKQALTAESADNSTNTGVLIDETEPLITLQATVTTIQDDGVTVPADDNIVLNNSKKEIKPTPQSVPKHSFVDGSHTVYAEDVIIQDKDNKIKNNQKKRNTPITIIVILCVLLLATIGLVYFIINNTTNDNDLQIEESSTETEETKNNSKTSSSSKEEYEYDNQGNITKKTVFSYSGKKERDIIYDANGQIVEKNEYNSSGELIKKEEYNYNKDGKLQESKKYDYELNIRIDYIYNDKGNIIKESWYDSDKLQSWSEYEYDSEGNETRMIQYDASGKVIGGR